MPVLRVPRVLDDMIDSLPTHQRDWNTGLAIQHCAKVTQFPDELTLCDAFSGVISIPLKAANPANISHGRLYSLDVELVLQTHGKTMERPNRLFGLGEVGIQIFCLVDCRIKEDFMQAVNLFMFSNKSLS